MLRFPKRWSMILISQETRRFVRSIICIYIFLDQYDDAMYRIILLRQNNNDYAKTINLLSYIPFAAEILMVEDSSVNDKNKGKYSNVLQNKNKKNLNEINQNMFVIQLHRYKISKINNIISLLTKNILLYKICTSFDKYMACSTDFRVYFLNH